MTFTTNALPTELNRHFITNRKVIQDVWAENYNRRALRSEVGLVFQYPEHQLFENTVLADVCFGPMNQGLSREQAEEEAKKALAHVGVKEENFTKSPFELSGGQKKRVAIAVLYPWNFSDRKKFRNVTDIVMKLTMHIAKNWQKKA